MRSWTVPSLAEAIDGFISSERRFKKSTDRFFNKSLKREIEPL